MSIEHPTERLVQIDGLRAIAALTVLVFHYTTRYDELYLHVRPLGFEFHNGTMGVLLFFAISGFVIFMTLDRTDTPFDFVVSRLSRLYPTYWVAVAITALFTAAFGLPGHEVSAGVAAANLTMLQDFFSLRSVDGVYWSLEYELLFYAIMLALWSLGLLRRATVVCAAWVCAGIAVEAAERLAGVHVSYALSYMLVLHYIPWFTIGMMAYVTLRDRRIGAGPALVLALAIGQIVARGQLETSVGAPLVAALIFVASRGALRWLAWRPLVYVGTISYPLYLLHENIGWIVIGRVERAAGMDWPAIAAAVAVALGLASLLHYTVEAPASKAIRAWYRAVKASRATHAFSRRRWLAGIAAVLGALGVSLIVTTRLAAHPPAPAVHLNPASPAAQPCVVPGARPPSLVIVLAQADAASHGRSKDASEPVRVFVSGTCAFAADPLPNTSGNGSGLWSAVTRRLGADASVGEVAIAPLATDAPLKDWVDPGVLHDHLHALLTSAHASGMPVMAVVLQHGELDADLATPAASYRDGLLALRDELDHAGIEAPLLVAKSTTCSGHPSDAIRRAVDQAVEHGHGLRAGPDLDGLGPSAHAADCGLTPSGRATAAELWYRELAPLLARRIATAASP